jgi:peptidoglycan-associated lipoprotein
MRKAPYRFIVPAVALLALLFSAVGCGPKVRPQPPGTTGATSKTQTPATRINSQTPMITIAVSPNAIEMGKSTTLSWDSLNATGVNIDNGIGTVEASGNRMISPKASTTYKAVATGQSGATATAEVRVTVTPPWDKSIIDPPSPSSPPPFDEVMREIKDAFFDYDQYNIRDDARTALQADALLLKKYPGVKLVIEGHCDERGSEKYNLALGDRRAIAAKDFLTEQGIDSGRIDTVSYGKEKNFCEEHNEDCYRLNRRAHFMLR